MSINKYNPTTGSLEAISQGRVWVGTKAEWQATVQSGSYPKNVLVAITDDEQEVKAIDVTSQLTDTTNCNLLKAYQLGNLLFVNGETKNTAASGTLFKLTNIGQVASSGRAVLADSDTAAYGKVAWEASSPYTVTFVCTAATYAKFNFVIPLA